MRPFENQFVLEQVGYLPRRVCGTLANLGQIQGIITLEYRIPH